MEKCLCKATRQRPTLHSEAGLWIGVVLASDADRRGLTARRIMASPKNSRRGIPVLRPEFFGTIPESRLSTPAGDHPWWSRPSGVGGWV